jgi:hypothetical protein
VIYFVQAVEIENAPIKIGYSEDVNRRLDQLEWNYRTPLALLATMPGGRDKERVIHARFSHLRIGTTEQFRPAQELMEFIGRPLLVGTNPETVEAMPSHGKPLAFQMRGETKWKTWVDELSTFDERPVAMIIERALREYAEKIGFPKSPPKR